MKHDDSIAEGARDAAIDASGKVAHDFVKENLISMGLNHDWNELMPEEKKLWHDMDIKASDTFITTFSDYLRDKTGVDLNEP